MYRPQFGYPPPPAGFEDHQFHYEFDSSNTPILATSIPATTLQPDIILPMQSDAMFIARGVKFQQLNVIGQETFYFQLKTPRGDYMQSVPVPINCYADVVIGLVSPTTGAAAGSSVAVPFNDEVECPPGSNWTLYLYNPLGLSLLPPQVTFFGVKRRKIIGK